MTERRFEGKTVVVTGASSGVGAAAARAFAAEGAMVVLAARGAEALEQVAKEIGDAALAVPTDVADPAAAEALLEKAEWAFGALHVLVNNAAVNYRGPVEGLDAADLAQIVDVNLRAPVVMTRLALPRIRRAGGGAIVNVASIAGQVPLPGEATYSATKFGLRGFSYALAEELRGSGITVSVVSPGPIDTGFLLDDLDEVPEIVFSQPMSSAEQVAARVLDCAADGRVERTLPQLTGMLATAGYLFPSLPRLIRPLLEAQGRRAKEKLRSRR